MDTVKIEGLDDLKAKLRDLPRKMRVRVLRNALSAGARLVRDEAKRNAPVLAQADRTPYRTPGLVRKSISVRTSKRDRRAGDVGVFVNVRPAKSGQRGAKSPTDPFYWRWLEFGWNPARAGESRAQRRKLNRAGASKRRPGDKFLTNAASKLPQALEVFKKQVGVWLQKVNASGKVTP
jgi:HK97 gp10 family phage protein